jgi:plastocyanin
MRGSGGRLAVRDPLPRRKFAGLILRFAVLPVVVAGCATAPAVPPAQPSVAAGESAGIFTVVLTDFAFTPDHIALRAGVPIRLRLVNNSKGGHDFSAPAFFAASNIAPGSTTPADGAIEVGSHQTVEIAVTPRVPGTYPVECTHFLHSLFGMTATIAVVS